MAFPEFHLGRHEDGQMDMIIALRDRMSPQTRHELLKLGAQWGTTIEDRKHPVVETVVYVPLGTKQTVLHLLSLDAIFVQREISTMTESNGAWETTLVI